MQNTVGRMLESGIDPHSLTIVDPACGSGSFLIEAFDVLDRWLAKTEPDVEAQVRRERILKENIFGVDLDEQAIEVTRLNLMLRASFSRRKLPYLTNIKHGNSLIEPPKSTTDGTPLLEFGEGLGVGSFNWQERFPDVFERGGFDVVIGNPPYVRQETLAIGFKEYAQSAYETYAGTADLYVYFVEKGYKLLRENGRMGYILPNKWLRANYGKKLREFLHDKAETLIDFGELPVFKDAGTFPLIMTLNKQKPLSPARSPKHGEREQKDSATDANPYPQPFSQNMEKGSKKATGATGLVPTDGENAGKATMPAEDVGEHGNAPINDNIIHVAQATQLPENNATLKSVLPDFYAVPRTALDKKGWSLAHPEEQRLLDKLKNCGVPLGDYVDGKIYRGVLTGLNEAFVIDRSKRDELIRQDPKSAELIKPFLAGRDVKRYQQPQSDKFLIFTRRGVNIDDYPTIKAYLEQYKEHLTPKPMGYKGKWNGRKAGRYQWYEIQDTVAYYEEFEKPKIVFPDIAKESRMTFDTQHTFFGNTVYFIPLNDLYLLALLNSKLIWFYFKNVATVLGNADKGGRLRWFSQDTTQIPIRKLDLNNPSEKAQHDKLVALVEKMLALKAEYAELEKSLNDRRHEVKESIERTDKAIDGLVYQLYGLTDEEIAIVTSP
ncbi:MAG: TaqI-like C-terminal specificity domain-containing protein [Anaerolineae bacterium]|nr:TaqI-like C-terminal specificity domain-containing protein [Anaerolineae bacterium]